MKIKKSELKSLIESYIYEQASLPTRPIDASDYPEEIETAAQKTMYNIFRAPEQRQTTSKFIASRHMPIFEDAFNQHIENWRVFSNAHPVAALFLQVIDISGVSGWADLATSIEEVNKPNATTFDQIKYFLNFLGALPIGMIFMGSGRILTLIANKILPIFNSANKVKALSKIFNSSDDWLELFKNVKEIKYFKDGLKKITDKLVEAGKITKESAVKFLEKANIFTKQIEKILSGLDSVPAKAFFKFLLAVSERIGESFAEHVLNFYIGNPDQASLHLKKGRDLGEFIYENSPSFFQSVIDKALKEGEEKWNWLITTAELN